MHSPDDSQITSRFAADILTRLRAQSPRVHCITNTVAQAFTANILLAAGALPSMTISAAEIGAFTEGSGALLINLGTFDGERREAVLTALEVVRHHGKPWVLDPVLIDRSPPRAGFAKALLARRPSALRLNAAELQTFGATADRAGVARFADESATVVALSGAVDFVSDGRRTAAIENGHALMARVTAMGCAASALVAACLTVESDPWRATAAALIILGVAGELAGARAAGPGSFAAALLDALFNLDEGTLVARTNAQFEGGT